jgi:uncharacterized membrane protein
MSEPIVPPPPPPPYSPPPPPSGPTSGGVSENRSLMIVLSYVPVLGIIPWLTEKVDTEVQWHARNGLLITAAEVAAIIVLRFLGFGLGFGCAFWLLRLAVIFAFGVVQVVGIIKGMNGQRLVIPGLSQLVNRF